MSNLREKHFEHVEQTFADALDTMLAKNHDYAEDENPYSNIEFGAHSAGITVEQGFLFLLGIKMSRLKQLLVAAKEPANESVEDTLEDTINYTAILKAYRTLKTQPADFSAEDFDGEYEEEEEPDYLGRPVSFSEPALAPAGSTLDWFKRFLGTPVQKV